MNTSKVYFTNLRTTPSSNLLDKMERLVKRAGIANIDFKNQFVAIKIHFGEPGNLAYIRPNYAARLVSLLRELGAKPFLTDCNTLYSGRRSNAVDHLQSAMENGFNPMSAGCNVIIADGVKGTDYREIEIDEYTKAVLADKPHFHVSFIMNVSPECDCWNHNDAAIIPDLGIAASFDPVALDKACADMVINAPIIGGNKLAETHPHEHLEGEDKFHLIHPDTNWQAGLRYAEEIGLGSQAYELITV